MAITEKTEFFQAQFGEFLDVSRAYGVGRPIRTLSQETNTVSLSTMKKAVNGEHIRPTAFHALKEVFGIKPLDWVELKIRYVENYLKEYLFQIKDPQALERLEQIDFGPFFRQRLEQKSLFASRAERFSFYIQTRFRELDLTESDIANEPGESGKRDKWTVSRQTVNAFQRGKHIKPEKFKLICRRLEINHNNRSIAKILYTEAFLGEYLLGENPKIFSRISQEEHPRTAALLIYSSQNNDILP